MDGSLTLLILNLNLHQKTEMYKTGDNIKMQSLKRFCMCDIQTEQFNQISTHKLKCCLYIVEIISTESFSKCKTQLYIFVLIMKAKIWYMTFAGKMILIGI